MSPLLDRAAFHVLALFATVHAALEHRASRFMCSEGTHSEEYLATVTYTDGTKAEQIVCARPGCTHNERRDVVAHG